MDIQDCVVEGTEVFTKDFKWLPIKDLTIGMEILANDEEGNAYFTPVTDLTVTTYKSPVMAFMHPYFNQTVTPTHRMPFLRVGTNILETQQAIQTKLMHKFPTDKATFLSYYDIKANSFRYIPTDAYSNKDLNLKIWIILLNTYCPNIVISIANGYLELKNISKIKNDIYYIKGKYFPTEVQDIIVTPQGLKLKTELDNINGELEEILNLSRLTYEQLTDIYNILFRIYSNVQVKKDEYFTMFSTFENLTFYQSIAMLCGYGTAIHKVNNSPRFNTKLCVTSKVDIIKGNDVMVHVKNYVGKVYCPTVKGGLFVIRHGGVTSITGNNNAREHLAPKKIFNQNSTESYKQATMIGGNPNGIINFNQTPHKAMYGLFKTASQRLWFPQEVNTSKDQQNYSKLTPEEKRAYDLVLAQLITNDSIQTNQLMDGINKYITCPVTNAALAVQAYQECYVEGTQILTKTGWKYFSNLTMDDYVANYEDDESITFTKPMQIIKKEYDDDGMYFIGDGYTQYVTKQHRIVYCDDIKTKYERRQNRENFLWIDSAEAIDPKGKHFPISGSYDIPIGNKNLTPVEKLAVMYMFLSGPKNFRDPNDNGVYTYIVEKSEHKAYIEELLGKAELPFEVKYKNNTRIKEYKVRLKMSVDAQFYWTRPLEKTLAWRQSFLSELSRYAVDTVPVIGYVSIYLRNAQAIETIQYIAAISNSATRVKAYDPTFYRVDINIGSMYKDGDTIQKAPIPYKGNVYCCTVNSGRLIVRYNDSVCVSGNCIHAESYSVMAEDIAQDTERIFNMHNEDEELHKKNQAVENMYRQLYDNHEHTGNPSKNEILMVFVANQILEELIFPGGFSVIYTLEHKLPSSAELIKEIHLDETLIHVELFKYIFRTTIKESFNNVVPEEVIEKSLHLIRYMSNVEINWLKYVTKGLLGYSDQAIEVFVKHKANNICKNLLLPLAYEEQSSTNPIETIIQQRFKGNAVESRTNFFEANATEYQKNSIIQDY